MNLKPDDKVTFFTKLKICLEILMSKSGSENKLQVKGLKLFEAGYACGFRDAMPKIKRDPIFRNDVI